MLMRRLLPLNSGSFVEGLRVYEVFNLARIRGVGSIVSDL